MYVFVVKMHVDRHAKNFSVYGIARIDLDSQKNCSEFYFNEKGSAKY